MEMTSNFFVAVDPGQTGALAFLSPSSLEIWDYPQDERGVIRLVKDISTRGIPTLTILEGQNAFPGQGVVSMFKLGMNYGIWLAAIASQEWPLRIVRPADWKRGLGYPAKAKAEGKEYSLTLARRLYPQAAEYLTRKKDHNRAEALLLAHFGKMSLVGKAIDPFE